VTVRCLRALEESASSEIALRRILVDNGSRDGTADAVSESMPDVLVVRNDHNAGYGEAVNRGARAGHGDYVLILNSDAIARPGAVVRLAELLDRMPDWVVAAGRLVHEGTDLPQVGFGMRSFPTLLGQIALMTGFERYWPGNPISAREAMLYFDYDRTQDVDGQPAGACLMCRRRDFDAVGGFDEAFFYWFEDVDLLRRLRERGRVGYVHDAVFEHVGAATFRQWSRPDVIVARYEGLLGYFGKHQPRREAITLGLAIASLAAIRVPPLAFFDRARAGAYVDVLRLALRAVFDSGHGRHQRSSGKTSGE
jgi:N-acetylglucosaminyl-diphospho-decaprenol L-rhamnosyltransferase